MEFLVAFPGADGAQLTKVLDGIRLFATLGRKYQVSGNI